MIKNIIFDIGNVLTDFRWREFLADKGFDDSMVQRIGEASVLSQVWNEFDRGVWSVEELLDAFAANDPEIGDLIRQAYGNIEGMVTGRAYAIPWIQALKAGGYRVYYLSNFSEKAYVECRDALDFLPEMDGGILSYRDGLIKPDSAIYKLLMTRYGLVPGECVFLDDTEKNVVGARNVGMEAICFRNQEQAIEELEKMGVVV